MSNQEKWVCMEIDGKCMCGRSLERLSLSSKTQSTSRGDDKVESTAPVFYGVE